MSTLRTEIDAYEEQKRQRVPQETLDTMAECTRMLEEAGITSGAIRAGDRLPDFSLPDQHGKTRRIGDYLRQGTLVLNIYRGGWCPYCNLEMKALATALPELQACGAVLVGMAPETPDHARDTATRHALTIDILSDTHNRVAEQLGLVFELPEPLRPIYDRLGIDIPAFNGDDSFRLPVPATLIVGTDGIVQHAFVDADYTRRMEPSDILERLDARRQSMA